VVAVLRLQDASVSTTGNSERAFERGGERVGHVIDPRSGRPAADLGSVTVIARTALEADALSTALFVLGPKAGIAFAASRPGVEALYALALPEGRVRLHATSGFAHLLEEVDPRLEFVAGAAR
jgi:thiamine biosynthesis lipoprotein